MDRLRCPINQLAEHLPHEPALIGHDRTYTWRQYDALVARASARLSVAGIVSGMRVAVCEPNSIELIVAIMALLRLGSVACPISTRLPHAGREETYAQCGADILLSLVGDAPSTSLKVITVSDILGGERVDAEIANVDLDRPATVIFTSGSSAVPKAALLSYGNHYFNALGSNENIAFGTGDRWLLSLPLHHVGGLAVLFRSMVSGGAVVLPENPENLVDIAKQTHATHLSLVSTQFIRFVEAFSAGVEHHLKAILLGGSAMPGFLVRSGQAIGLPLFTSYGMTEMGSQVATTTPGDTLEHLLTSGRPLRYREIYANPDGEILVRGKTRFLGYVNGKSLDTPFDSDGWYHTGDLGQIAADGYVHVTGRKDNMFISGGENIQPEEIERYLTQLEFVMDAVVVPVPDHEFGYRPAAFVRTLDGRPLDERYAVMHLERFIPRFKIPDFFFSWPESEPGLKIDRKMLSALARQTVK